MLKEKRNELTLEAMARDFFPGLPREEVIDCLEMLAEEGIPVGLLRPSDGLPQILQPPPTWNPFRWLRSRPAYEDILMELKYRLGSRMRARGWSPSRQEEKVKTLADFVELWCRPRFD
jgi:hypothetical protein